MILAPELRKRFSDANNVPLAGGQIFSYAAGTTTPQVTYSNSTGTTNSNPVVLDADGYADVWLDPSLSYKFVLEDVNNNVIWTVDNVSTSTGSSVTTVTSNQTLTATSGVIRSNSTSGNLMHTLPACSSTLVGIKITVKDVGSGTYTTSVQGNGSDNIDGSNVFSQALRQNMAATFVNNGTSWDSI